MDTKKCNKCGRELPLDAFHKNQYYCKDCKNALQQARYARLREERDNNGGGKLLKVYSSEELAKFTPRQLMQELKARGFKWDYMLEPQRKIEFDKI